MDLDPQNIGTTLDKFVNRRDYNNAKKYMQQLNHLLTTQLALSLRDAYIVNIFNKDTGIPNFIERTLRDDGLKDARSEAMEVLHTLINNFPNKVNNTAALVNACISLAHSNANFNEKKKAYDLIALVMKKVSMPLDLAQTTFDKLYSTWLIEKPDTVQGGLTKTLGTIAKVYPSVVNNPIELQSRILNQLEVQVLLEKKKYSIISASFVALSDLLENFPLDANISNEVTSKLYHCVFKTINITVEVKTKLAARAALYFFSKHSNIIANNLYMNIKEFHGVLLRYLSYSAIERKVVVEALLAYYREISNLIKNDMGEAQSKLVMDFLTYFMKTINKSESNVETGTAINGIGIFAEAFSNHLKPHEFSKTFIDILQKVEHMYLFSTEPTTESLEFLPNYVEAISALMQQTKLVTNNQMLCFQQVLIFLIKVFPRVSVIYHQKIIVSFVTTVRHIMGLKNKEWEYYLSNVIYQGIIWSCSHGYPLDINEQETVTYKSYLPFWKGILRPIDTGRNNVSEKGNVSTKIFDELMKTLFVLINKLNLNTKVKDITLSLTNPESTLEIVQINDYEIYLNLTDLYVNTLGGINPLLFDKWVLMYANQIIIKISKNTLISGFYKLLSALLTLCDNDSLRYFDTIRDEEVQLCFNAVQNCIKEMLWRMKQYNGDLQISCLEVLVSSPAILITDLLPSVTPAFVTLFSIGRSHFKLAQSGLDTLKRWNEIIPAENMKPFLKEVVPTLDTYLRSKSLMHSNSDSITKPRKTKQILYKRRVLIEAEPELLKLQKNIVTFVGMLDSDLCYSFVSDSQNAETIAYSDEKYLKLSLPDADFYLDSLLPRIVELVLYTSDRKTRMAACELLQAIVILMLGKAREMGAPSSNKLDGHLKKLASPLLRLGCDLDEPVQKVFKPLVLTLIHWYTHSAQFESSHPAIFIETIMDGITHPSDSAVRDFSGLCVKEYVIWTIKQSTPSQLAENPKNIKLLVKNMRTFSLHCDPSKRLGAALIFNNIYRELREEEPIFNMFWLEILYAFVMNMSLIEINCPEDNNCFIQVTQALDHVQRGFVEKCSLFNKANSKRRIPPNFDGTNLKEVALWLLKNTGSKNPHCREKTMQMFKNIAPLVTGCNNSVQMFMELYVSLDTEWIIRTYESHLKECNTFENLKSAEDLFNWLQSLHCSLDGYMFVAGLNGMTGYSLNNESIFFSEMKLFIEKVHNRSLKETLVFQDEQAPLSVLEKELFNTIRSQITMKILKFCITVLKDDHMLQALDSFFDEGLMNLVCNMIFDMPSLGFDIYYDESNYKGLLLDLLKLLKEKLPIDKITQIFSCYLVNKSIGSTTLNRNVPLKQRLIIKGMLLLRDSVFADVLNMYSLCNGIVKNIFESLFEASAEARVTNHLNDTNRSYCNLKLQLALMSESEFTSLLGSLYNQTKVNVLNTSENTKCGKYFFETFKDVVMNEIIKRFEKFLEIVLKKEFFLWDTIYYLNSLLDYIRENKKQFNVNILKSITKTLLLKWANFEEHFSRTYESNLQGLIFLQKLAYILPFPIYFMGGNEYGIGKWILKMMVKGFTYSSPEVIFDFRIQVVELLPCVANPQLENESLTHALKFLQNTYYSPANTTEVSNVILFNKLLDVLKISKSLSVLLVIAEIFITNVLGKNLMLDDVLKEYMLRLHPDVQLKSLETIYNMLSDNSTCFQRYKLATSVFSQLLISSSYSEFERFFQKQIVAIKNNLKNDNNTSEIILQKTVSFVLVEILFFKIDMGKIEEGTCSITEAAGTSLLKDFTGFALKSCKETLFSTDQDAKELFRLYQCHSYNALVSIATAAKKKDLHKFLFIRSGDLPDLIWRSLLDLDKKYEFVQDFDDIPTWKKKLVNIRTEVRANKKLRGSESASVQYIQSQSLFNSTLCEDMSRFDFTNTVLRTQLTETEDNSKIEETVQSEIQLESLEINNHECMATICGLVEYLCNDTPVPTNTELIELPPWLEGLKTVMMDDRTHVNVKIYLAKVVENLKEVLKPFAKWFYFPIMKLIVDGHAGTNINFFVYDMVAMVTWWTTQSNGSIPSSEEEIVSKLFEFLIRNAYNQRRDMYKNNLELIKTFVEAWKKQIQVPFEVLLSKLKLPLNCAEIDAAVQVTAILLSNHIVPWGGNSPKDFLTTLSCVLKSDTQDLYLHASETIGMVLQLMHENSAFVKFFDLFQRHVISRIEKSANDMHKFLCCLERIARNYPQIAEDKFLRKCVFSLESVPGKFKCMCLNVMSAQYTGLREYLPLIKFNELLVDTSVEVQILTLEVIFKCVDYFSVKLLNLVLQSVLDFSKSSSLECRKWMYKIIIKVYNMYKDNNEELTSCCKNALISGLADNNIEIQEELFTFWCEQLPKKFPERLQNLLSDLYNPANEQYYLGYSTQLLLNILKSDGCFKEKIFNYVLQECTFQEYKLYGHWRAQHASVIPMFADTLRSQTQEPQTFTNVNIDILRATQQSFAFEPTQTMKQDSQYSKISSSLLFTQDNSDAANEFKNPNDVNMSQKYRIYSRRFYKDKNKISKHMAQYKVKEKEITEKARIDLTKEKERGVTFYRKYRAGDFPDVEITFSDVILPLQVLVKHDLEISRVVYTSLFEGIFNKIDSKEAFLESVNIGINNIFSNSNQFIPSVVGAFLDIVLKHKDVVKLVPSVVTNVCRYSGLESIGSLLLEEYLISGVESVAHSSKRSRGNEDDAELEHWARLAELYKEMDEWDVVQAIFVEKVNCSEDLAVAVRAEAQGNWKLAQKHYSSLIETDSSLYNKDFYYDSYIKCFQNLTEWEELTDVVKKEISLPCENIDWNKLWDQDWNQRKLLPCYITAKLRNLLSCGSNDNELVTEINKSLKDPEKAEYLKANFSEELAILFLLNGDLDMAKQYLDMSISTFLEHWHNLSTLFSKRRYSKFLNLRNTVDFNVFIEGYNNLLPINCEENVPKLLKFWLNTNETLNLIMLNETRTLYRKEFVSALEKKFSSFLDHDDEIMLSLNKTKFQLDLNLINAALNFENIYVARKCYRLLHAEHENTKYDQAEEMHLKLTVSKLYYLKSHFLTGEDSLKCLIGSWNHLAPVIEYSQQDVGFVMPTKQHLFKTTKEISNILSTDAEMFVKYRSQIEEYTENADFSKPENIEFYGVVNLQQSISFCHQHLDDLESKNDSPLRTEVADAYLNLANYAQNKGTLFERDYICCILRALKLGSISAIHLFPCILDIEKLGQTYNEIFIDESADIPPWMFLRWIPQLLANVDTDKVFAIKDIIVKIAKTYPQAMMYAYRLSKESYNIDESEMFGLRAAELITELDDLLENESISTLLRALSCVNIPANSLRHCLLRTLKATDLNSVDSLKAAITKIKRDFFSEKPDSKNVTKMHGNMYKAIMKYESKLDALTKQRFDVNKVKMALNSIAEELKHETKTSVNLADYCPWLENFHDSNLNADIEIPGQYSGLKRPLMQYHIKISGFYDKVKIMSSVRKPIKITIFGNDTKEYSYLVKSGEDLRQDQRVEQMFYLVNNILRNNRETSSHQLAVFTYQVIPLKPDLGIIEWVDDTCDFLEFILTPEIKEKLKQANEVYQCWIDDVKPERNCSNLDKYGTACVKYTRDKTIAKFQELINFVPWNIFRTAFRRMSINSESFVALKNNFIKSYSVLCVVHWLLGIGDRHLSNTKICRKNGAVVGIDFGHAFGTATQLNPVPEIVPFRLSPHIVNLMLPLGENGLFKETMINVLRTLCKHSDLLLATMNIFIEEPSLEWKVYAQQFMNVNGESKISQVKRKFRGANPAMLAVQDVEANAHIHKYKKSYTDIAKGRQEFNVRASCGDNNLSVEDQVACLIDLATDYNILGRIYAGYNAWV